MSSLRRAAAIAVVALSTSLPARADVQIIGPGLPADYSGASDTNLWSLVGGVTVPSNKNAILQDYVVATNASGQRSVFSLGELDPSFGGTNLAPYVAYSGGTYSLVDPNTGAAARGLSNLTSLQVVGLPSLTGAGGVSTSLTLSGASGNAGTYTLSQLQSGFTPTTVSANGETYTGVPLYTFLAPTSSNVTSQIVVVTGTDGYEVVFSLAEIDPALGGNANDILPYASSGSDFTTGDDGLARVITPLDNKHGRWVSNVNLVAIESVPEPSTWAMMLLGFAGLGLAAWRRSKTSGAFVRA